MTVVHIEKISTGLWTISANFKTELKQDLHYSSTRSRTACLKHPILLYLQFYLYQKLYTCTDDLCYSYEYENVRHTFVSKQTDKH